MDRPKTVKEFAYEKLKENILTGLYRPGERITETNLAEDLMVSRTPIRDAINRLESEGLITSIPHRGIFVTQLTLKNIQDFYDTRLVLEGLAAKLAADNATDGEIADFQEFLNDMEAIFERDKSLVNYKEIAQMNNKFHRLICKMSKNDVLTRMLASLDSPITLIRATAWTEDRDRKFTTLIEHRQIAAAIINRDGSTAQRKAEEHIYNAGRAAIKALEKGDFQNVEER